MAKEFRTYYYRGMIERGAKFDWREGYSADSAHGLTIYPWNTKRECQQEAKREGKQARFVRNRAKQIA